MCVERYSTAIQKYNTAKEEISGILTTAGVDEKDEYTIKRTLQSDEERRLGRRQRTGTLANTIVKLQCVNSHMMHVV